MNYDNSILKMSITEMHNGLKKKDFSVRELFDVHKQQIIEHNSYFNSIIDNGFSYGEQRIDALQKKVDNEKEFDVLTGIPLVVKDNYCVKGLRTTACSKMLEEFVPEYTSTVVERLENHGMLIIGKANMDEFALGSANQNSYFGDVQNPMKNCDNEEIIPGGSSGGSASAVSTFFAPASLGSDTGGSVRQPAACCGIIGLKPTYGMFSRFGIITFASSLDQSGIFARNVEDCALLFDAMKGFDPKDNSSLNQKPDKIIGKLNQVDNVNHLKLGYVDEFAKIEEGLMPEIQSEIEKLSKTVNSDLFGISLPNIKYSLATYYTLCCAEIYSNIARFDGLRYGSTTSRYNHKSFKDFYQEVRNNNFGDELKLRIMTGNYLLSNKSASLDKIFPKANLIRSKLVDDFQKAFKNVDVIITPIFINKPRKMIGQANAEEDRVNDTFTSCINLVGLPALSLPLFEHEGFPIAIQLIANYGQELQLLQLAKILTINSELHVKLKNKLFNLTVKNNT